MRQVGLFDEGVRPEALHQLLFFNQSTAVLDQYQQRVKGFWRQRHHRTVTQQKTFRHIQAKWTEFIEAFGIAVIQGLCGG